MSQKRTDGASKCSSSGCCGGLSRRELLQLMGLGAASALAAKLPVMAGPFEASDFEKLVPADKKLSPDWVKSLVTRGQREVYSGAELEKIGMPVGGICTGQLYLGGDGKLWQWDIFNRIYNSGTSGPHYAKPLQPASPLERGFALRITAGGKTQVRTLDRAGFSGVSFCGEYPIGFVEYRDDTLPVAVSLEAFAPFIPLNPDDSNLPATVLRFTIKNTGSGNLDCELGGWLENAVCLRSASTWSGVRRNRSVRRDQLILLECSAGAVPPSQPHRPAVVFADFEGETYGDWKVEGEAFGKAPAKGPMGNEQKLKGYQGKGLVNTYLFSDKFRGKLTSPAFTVERPFISFLIGGGNHPGEACINLVVDGKVVRTQTGKNSDALEWANWNVRDLAGKRAHLEIVDNHSGDWGHIAIDQIEFCDRPRGAAARLEAEADFGTMALALLDGAAGDEVVLALPAGNLAEEIFPPPQGVLGAETAKPFPQKLVGAVKRKRSLEPGASAVVTFVLTWHFPNLAVAGVKGSGGRHAAKRFASAAAVAEYVAKNFALLSQQTRLWHDTWYDSTLPYWFLDRTFATASVLATSTCHWFSDGRFYGWEGVGCCTGTCTHVWHYAHAVARLFPQLERDLRERTDFGLAFNRDTGVIRFRGEGAGLAIDGQAGCILRSYREHQMSADDAFLKRSWPTIKKALECLIQRDGDGDGIIEGPQHNTLDADWFGKISWLSSLYVAALRAGEAMAREVGDEAFAKQARAIADAGSKQIDEQLFNGEYYIQIPDKDRAKTVGSYDGCEIDQVFGQSWAFQVNLGRILPEPHVKSALAALWKYNFTPDVGPYRNVHKPGRWYALPGEGGLLMCTWPKGEAARVRQAFDYYFNECMTGFEYQVAGHMIGEGMVKEGLAITRAIHDRYHPARRNPWNEVECGDHYARSMASYGVFLAACGYEYHGPKGHLGFAPRLAADDFRAAFTAAEGWGTFTQQREGNAQRNTVAVQWGKLRLRTIALAVPENMKPATVRVMVNGKVAQTSFAVDRNRVTIAFADGVNLEANQKMEVSVT